MCECMVYVCGVCGCGVCVWYKCMCVVFVGVVCVVRLFQRMLFGGFSFKHLVEMN